MIMERLWTVLGKTAAKLGLHGLSNRGWLTGEGEPGTGRSNRRHRSNSGELSQRLDLGMIRVMEKRVKSQVLCTR
jgi:hypothetical protein